MYLDIAPASPGRLDQDVDLADARLGGQFGICVGPAQHAKDAAQLGEHVPSDLLDRGDASVEHRGAVSRQPLHRGGLDDHTGDSLCDRRVQIAGDLGAFLRDRQAIAVLCLGRQALRLAIEFLGELPRVPYRPARAPGHGAQAHGDEVAADARRPEVRDRQDPGLADGQARKRLPPGQVSAGHVSGSKHRVDGKDVAFRVGNGAASTMQQPSATTAKVTGNWRRHTHGSVAAAAAATLAHSPPAW